MGVGKQHATRREPVKVGRDRLFIASHTTNPIVQIIHRDEKDIGLRCVFSTKSGDAGQEAKQQQLGSL